MLLTLFLHFSNIMAIKTLLPLCLLVSSVLATPVQIRSSPITLPVAVKVKSTGGPQALVNRDRARARALFAHGQAKAQGKSFAEVPPIPVTDAGVNMQSFLSHFLARLILFPLATLHRVRWCRCWYILTHRGHWEFQYLGWC